MKTRKIIGYLSPMDLFNGLVKQGSLFTFNSSTSYTFKNNICVLPKEIVETWEPVYEDSFEVFLPEELDFNKNWNSLMEVVEKIESIRDEEYGWFQVYISSNACSIQSQHLWKVLQGQQNVLAYTNDSNAIFPTKIDSTFYNVVRFVEWYNELLERRANK